jgi:hypothetical protein
MLMRLRTYFLLVVLRLDEIVPSESERGLIQSDPSYGVPFHEQYETKSASLWDLVPYIFA